MSADRADIAVLERDDGEIRSVRDGQRDSFAGVTAWTAYCMLLGTVYS